MLRREVGLGYACDRLNGSPAETAASLEQLRATFLHKDDQKIFALAEGDATFPKITLPSSEAQEVVATAFQSVEFLYMLSREAEQTALKDQASSRGREAPRKKDDLRYLFVFVLSLIFRRFLGLLPKSTIDGPWVAFLATVLSRCERKPMTPEAAKSLWLNLPQRKQHWKSNSRN